MNEYRVTYTYTDGGGDIEDHNESTVLVAIHQGLMRPNVGSFTVDKLYDEPAVTASGS